MTGAPDPGRASGGRGVAAERGQATVELVALLPVVVVVVLGVAHLLAAGAVAELADHAAEAAAVAMLQDADPRAAARKAVPGWSRRAMSVQVRGRRVRVRMRAPSPLPGLGDALAATREADAGPGAP